MTSPTKSNAAVFSDMEKESKFVADAFVKFDERMSQHCTPHPWFYGLHKLHKAGCDSFRLLVDAAVQHQVVGKRSPGIVGHSHG